MQNIFIQRQAPIKGAPVHNTISNLNMHNHVYSKHSKVTSAKVDSTARWKAVIMIKLSFITEISI